MYCIRSTYHPSKFYTHFWPIGHFFVYYYEMKEPLPKSALEYVLCSLVPFSDSNLKLSFAPKQFFRDLEAISRNKRRTLQNAYYRAAKDGFVDTTDKRRPRLTNSGQRKIRRLSATKRGDNQHLMLVFDIPESQRQKRQQLRQTLRELKFEQVQKSVWISQYDYLSILKEEIAEHHLQSYVRIYTSTEVII